MPNTKSQILMWHAYPSVLSEQAACIQGGQKLPCFGLFQTLSVLVSAYSCVCVCVSITGTTGHELEVLQQVLSKLSIMHVSKSVKKNAVPFNLPQLDPSIVSVLHIFI